MAESKMNKAYWVAHKAKTLLDSGDTVAKALEMWDKDKAKSPQNWNADLMATCLLYTSPSPRDRTRSRMPSSA